jgi:copper resistance protein B
VRRALPLLLVLAAPPALAQEHDHSQHGGAGGAAPPPVARDHAADAVYDPAAMARARTQLRLEHGGMGYSKLMLETAEIRSDDGYGWEGFASLGGDINRFVLKSEGDGAHGDLESAEAQALYSRAVTPYFNLQGGIRQEFGPSSTTYAVAGVEGLAPYWFEIGAFAFLSEDGELSARAEASYDLRLTQRLILEPRAEFDAEEGRGLSSGEYGLRLRYAVRPEFAPYVGVHYERRYGEAADLAAAAGEPVSETRTVVGLRAWF